MLIYFNEYVSSVYYSVYMPISVRLNLEECRAKSH